MNWCYYFITCNRKQSFRKVGVVLKRTFFLGFLVFLFFLVFSKVFFFFNRPLFSFFFFFFFFFLFCLLFSFFAFDSRSSSSLPSTSSKNYTSSSLPSSSLPSSSLIRGYSRSYLFFSTVVSCGRCHPANLAPPNTTGGHASFSSSPVTY